MAARIRGPQSWKPVPRRSGEMIICLRDPLAVWRDCSSQTPLIYDGAAKRSKMDSRRKISKRAYADIADFPSREADNHPVACGRRWLNPSIVLLRTSQHAILVALLVKNSLIFFQIQFLCFLCILFAFIEACIHKCITCSCHVTNERPPADSFTYINIKSGTTWNQKHRRGIDPLMLHSNPKESA
jgi:hypothetical protein